jgi:orotidine-5'-phosphate decarboxylase
MASVSAKVTPIVALDVSDAATALKIVDELGDLCRFYKIGGELYTAEGPEVVRAISARGADVFLDLKFHDIPNTVRGAVRSAASLGVQLLTIHASGGRAMIAAALEGARDVASTCEIFAVTVLTSLDNRALSVAWGRPVSSIPDEVVRLAQLARDEGLHGIVCSGEEAAVVRDRFGEDVATLVPGVRLAGSERNDQVRVVTPHEAAEAGARYIVVGRAVTAAKSPRDAMSEVLSDLP